MLPGSHIVPSQQTEPGVPQQKPRESQVGAAQVVFEVHFGKHTGTPEVPTLRSHT